MSVLCAYLFVEFTLDPLPAGTGGLYVVLDADSTNMCFCNTVSYSLLSACAACQEAGWTKCGYIVFSSQLPAAYVSVISWSDFVYNCSEPNLLPPST